MSIEEYLDEGYREEFSRVVSEWKIGDVKKNVTSSYGSYEAHHGGIDFRLENERGCLGCLVRPK